MDDRFIFKKAELSDHALMEEIYRLRFEVYCHECGFIKAEDYPDGIENDKYDPQSIHFVAIDSENGGAIATLRMIQPGALELPILHHCPDVSLPKEAGYSEISRLVISRRLRRRADDKMYYGPQVTDQNVVTDQGEYLRRARPMAFGLYREMYRESKRLGLTHWFSLMEKSLWLLLALHGFKFACAGKEVDVYGPVRPYIGDVAEIEVEVKKKFPDFFKYFVQS